MSPIIMPLTLAVFGLTAVSLAGGMAGYAVMVRRLRAATRGAATYADLRPRRVVAYRPAWQIWLLWGYAAAIAGLGLTRAFGGAATPVRIILFGGGSVMLPATPWLFALAPLALAAVLLAGRAAQGWVVAAPRLVTADDLALAPRLDDMLRARFIGVLQQQMTLLTALLAANQWALVFGRAPGDASGAPESVLFVITLVAILGLFVFGLAAATRLITQPPARRLASQERR